ncbi:MAG: glycosyltransferase [Candidatus Dadabacteria bacterium]|nr:MAG: glycosyltransferase [Candidatus Dadabacteria bacterium]
MRQLKIAILGTRGIPARYGGFETFAEELSQRLVLKGHQVSVYARKRFFEKKNSPGEYAGVHIRYTATIMHKYFETPVHAVTSLIDVLFKPADVILLCNAANAPFAWITAFAGMPVVINVDGIERKRAKWNLFGRLWYMLGERCAVWFSKQIIADAEVIAEYYRNRYKASPVVIAYGATAKRIPAGETLARFNLKARNYILYVSRLEPENNALGVIEAYNSIDTDVPLVIVGDAPYADQYKKLLKEKASDKVVFTGFQFGEAYHELQSNALIYIQATEVGGTHPALVEAMAHGNCIIANGTPENMEVLADCGEYYKKNNFKELAVKLKNLLSDGRRRTELSEKARKRAEGVYNWDKVTEEYLRLFKSVLNK